jgi:hypothetical protein
MTPVPAEAVKNTNSAAEENKQILNVKCKKRKRVNASG